MYLVHLAGLRAPRIAFPSPKRANRACFTAICRAIMTLPGVGWYRSAGGEESPPAPHG
jgi:hypothetical protein